MVFCFIFHICTKWYVIFVHANGHLLSWVRLYRINNLACVNMLNCHLCCWPTATGSCLHSCVDGAGGCNCMSASWRAANIRKSVFVCSPHVCSLFFPFSLLMSGRWTWPAHPPTLIPTPHLSWFTHLLVCQIIIDLAVALLLEYLHVWLLARSYLRSLCYPIQPCPSPAPNSSSSSLL